MGIADEIERLNELHRTGALNDQEFARAKASILGADEPTTNSKEYSEKFADFESLYSTTARVQKSYFNAILLGGALLVIVIAIAWTFLQLNVQNSPSSELAPAPAPPAPVELLNMIENLPANAAKGFPLNVTYDGHVDISVEVVRGNPIDIHVVDPWNMQQFREGEAYRQFGEFEATETKTYRRASYLSSGTYYLIFRDKTLGLLSENSSDIKVYARLTP